MAKTILLKNTTPSPNAGRPQVATLRKTVLDCETPPAFTLCVWYGEGAYRSVPCGASHRLRKETGDWKCPLPFSGKVCHLTQQQRAETPAERRVTP